MIGFIATDADGFSAIYSTRPICNQASGIGHCYCSLDGARIPLNQELTTGIAEKKPLTIAQVLGIDADLIESAKKEPICIVLGWAEYMEQPNA